MKNIKKSLLMFLLLVCVIHITNAQDQIPLPGLTLEKVTAMAMDEVNKRHLTGYSIVDIHLVFDVTDKPAYWAIEMRPGDGNRHDSSFTGFNVDLNGHIEDGKLARVPANGAIASGDSGNLAARSLKIDTGIVRVGAGSDVDIVGAYGLFTATSGNNAGVTLNRDDPTGSYSSLDFLENGSTSTGWSIQMKPGSEDLHFVNRAKGLDGFGLSSSGGVSADNGHISSDGSGSLTVGGNLSVGPSGGPCAYFFNDGNTVALNLYSKSNVLQGQVGISSGDGVAALANVIAAKASLNYNWCIFDDGSAYYGNDYHKSSMGSQPLAILRSGHIAMDKGVITTDGSGNLKAASFIGNGNSLTFTSVPASASAPGTAGQIAQDGTYLYTCIRKNTWTRASLSTLGFAPW